MPMWIIDWRTVHLSTSFHLSSHSTFQNYTSTFLRAINYRVRVMRHICNGIISFFISPQWQLCDAYRIRNIVNDCNLSKDAEPLNGVFLGMTRLSVNRNTCGPHFGTKLEGTKFFPPLHRWKRFNLQETDKILGFPFLAGQTDIRLRLQNFSRDESNKNIRCPILFLL